jgi:uroporphyrinogen-III synthase
MKYFCVTETIALYIQKYVQYRKRKVFFGSTGRIDDLIPTMVKHKTEKYLVPMSDVHNDSLTLLLDSKKLNHKEVVMYRTVSNDFTPEEVKNFDYDMLIFFSPSGIESLTKNFPDFRQGEIAIATFGPATAKAAKDAGLRLDIEAPSEKYPSMTGALQHYLFEIQD